MEILHYFKIFRLTRPPNDAIMFDFNVLLPCNDVTLDSLFVPLVSILSAVCEEHEIVLFSSDVP